MEERRSVFVWHKGITFRRNEEVQIERDRDWNVYSTIFSSGEEMCNLWGLDIDGNGDNYFYGDIHFLNVLYPGQNLIRCPYEPKSLLNFPGQTFTTDGESCQKLNDAFDRLLQKKGINRMDIDPEGHNGNTYILFREVRQEPVSCHLL